MELVFEMTDLWKVARSIHGILFHHRLVHVPWLTMAHFLGNSTKRVRLGAYERSVVLGVAMRRIYSRMNALIFCHCSVLRSWQILKPRDTFPVAFVSLESGIMPMHLDDVGRLRLRR